MSKKTIGKWERDPVHGGSIYFATYCGECKEKVYLSQFQAQQFIDKVSLSLQGKSLWAIIRERVGEWLPKFRVKIEWGDPSESKELGIDSDRKLDKYVMDLHHEKYKY